MRVRLVETHPLGTKIFLKIIGQLFGKYPFFQKRVPQKWRNVIFDG